MIILTNEELVERYQQGDSLALEEIIKNNMGIIHIIARKFNIENTSSIDYDDLIQEGTIGLIIAAGKYKLDMEGKASFTTYAIYWIRQKISRFMQYRNTNSEISLNKPAYSEDDETELGDTIQSEENEFCRIEDSVYYKQLNEELKQVMDERLSLQQKQVVQYRYGLECKAFTLSELGDLFSLSVERIRQIELESLKRMRTSTWGRRMMAERNLEQKERLLSPGARDAHEQYAIFEDRRTSVLDILKRVQAEREQMKVRLLI